MGCHSLLQGISSTQGLNAGFLHWQVGPLLSEPPGKPAHIIIYKYSLRYSCTLQLGSYSTCFFTFEVPSSRLLPDFLKYVIYFFMAAWVSAAARASFFLVGMHGLLIAVASLIMEHGL